MRDKHCRANSFADTMEIKIPNKKKTKKFKPAPPTINHKRRKTETAEEVLRFTIIIVVTVLLTMAIGTALFALYCYCFDREAFEKCRGLFGQLATIICAAGFITPWVAIGAICIISFFDR